MAVYHLSGCGDARTFGFQVVFHGVDAPQFILSPAEGCLGSFQLGALQNKAITNCGV